MVHNICPMHRDMKFDKPGRCPVCGMELILSSKLKVESGGHGQKMDHHEHSMKPVSKMSFWEKFKMSMTMSMGMEHGGLAGREMAKLMEEDIRNKFFFALLLTIPIIAYSPIGMNVFGLNLPTPIPLPWILFILTTPVFFYSGWIFLYSSVKAIQAKILNMSVLIAVGITAAYGFSVMLTLIGRKDSYYEAAAMLITFVLFGHWMEMKSRRGTTDALQALFNLVPPQARIYKNGKETLVATSEVRLGDIVILKPGDKVPVDGEITEGETSIDESLVTGESLPIEKKKRDMVIGGSINLSGSVKFCATKVGADTALAQIVKMVETAQNSKAPGQKLADRFAQYLVILAVGSGLATFGIWFFIAGQPLLTALTFAISAIVIACPDALGLATPTAVAVGTGIGAKHNILIKDAPTLEGISKIQAIVFDKTGTLTEGKPKVVDIEAVSGFSENKVLEFVAAAEFKSSHPLSSAVVEALKNKKLKMPERIEKFENLAGHGVRAKVNGENVLVGTLKLMQDNKIDITPIEMNLEKLVDKGETIILFALNGKIKGVIGASDQIKPNTASAIKKLNSLNIETVMITGDNQATADIVAKKLGIKRVFAQVLPQDKAEYIKKLQKEGKYVGMVGDGVNDAPALAQANVGIAIGAGTDVAIETAKVVLMRSDPGDVLRAIKLSKATVVKMKQNLFWASIYNLLAIPVAAGVLYPAYHILLRPEIAALLMSVSSIIVATNAVLLKRVEKQLVEV